MIKLFFDLSPKAKGRPRFCSKNNRVFAYTDKNTRLYEKDIKAMAIEQYKSPPLNGPLKIEITFYIKPPKTVKRKYPSVKPDLDNLIKSLLDPLNGVVFNDDAQVISLVSHKRYRDDAGIELIILPIS